MDDEWDRSDVVPNFEDRYAEELEMLDELDDDFDPPPSKRKLNFGSAKKTSSVPECSEREWTNERNITKKRDCYHLYGPLPECGSDEEVDDILTGIYGPKKKKVCLSPKPIKTATQKTSLEDSFLDDIPNGQNYSLASSQKCSQQTWRNQTTSFKIQTKVLKRAPVTEDFVTITRSDGERFFIEVESDGGKHSHKEGTRKKQMSIRSLQLLSMPFSVLRQHVEDQRRRKLLEESEQITASLRRTLEADPDVVEETDNETHDGIEDERSGKHALWVDRYAPRHFTELLSDDCINRNLLKWLKLWDRVVFHKDKKQRTTAAQKQKNKENQKKKQPFKASLDDDAEWNELDKTGRPVKKVSLLCGPPGLGKTTLAHVIAKHAGYNVVEMNASDDRSVDVFRNKIESATQMESVLGQDERPNCLVIDEIDGAPTPAINALLTIIKNKDGGAQKSRKKKKVEPLSRPIICICNDQFVPSLRPLRQCALVTVFPTTVPGRLAGRLLEVSKKEQVKTDMTTLLALCEKAECDIRSCLNTLQFVHKRHGGQVSLEHIQSADIGQKDAHKNLFSIWQEIFRLPKPKRRRFAGPANHPPGEINGDFLSFADIDNDRHVLAAPASSGMSAMATRFHNILHSAMSNGQYDKVAQGLFENYLQAKFKDPGLQLVVSGTEWLEFSDFIQESVNHHQSFMLQKFSPFLSVAFHIMFASASHTKISYPSSQYEYHLRQTNTTNIMMSILSDCSPCVKRNLNMRVCFLELFPLLLEIITPNMRPVSSELFSASEKLQLAELIDTMIKYNMTYHQEKNFDGHFTYVLDPNVEEAVKFPGLSQHRQLTYNTKHLIAQGIQHEKIKRTEEAMKDHFQSSSAVARGSERQEGSSLPVMNKQKVKQEKPVVDFFGRIVKPNPTNDQIVGQNSVKRETHTLKSLIWFQFNEGFSNAVRKNVKVQKFL